MDASSVSIMDASTPKPLDCSPEPKPTMDTPRESRRILAVAVYRGPKDRKRFPLTQAKTIAVIRQKRPALRRNPVSTVPDL